METIKNYLDNMFAGFPKTPEIMKLKNDLMLSMEDKYNELKYSGKSENEAVGIVISEFGNIDELVKEMGISTSTVLNEKPLPLISMSIAEEFIQSKKRFGTVIAFGVWLCIMAPAALTLLNSTIVPTNTLSGEKLEALTLIPFFLMIACAVGLFIYSGMQLEKYEYLKKPFTLAYGVEDYISKKKFAYQGTFTLCIVVGVMLCILSPLAPILMSFENGFNENEPSSYVSVTILLFLISIAVFLFIHSGSIMDSYKELLQEGDYDAAHKKENKVIGAIAAFIWPLTTACYLLWSFITGDWAHTWIIWPIVAICFGAISAVVNTITSDK